VQNSFWKNLQTYHKMDYRMNKYKQGEKVVVGDQYEADENKRMQ